MANASILAAFERMWQHIVSALNKKSDLSHSHVISEIPDLQEQLEKITQVQIVTWESDD